MFFLLLLLLVSSVSTRIAPNLPNGKHFIIGLIAENEHLLVSAALVISSIERVCVRARLALTSVLSCHSHDVFSHEQISYYPLQNDALFYK